MIRYSIACISHHGFLIEGCNLQGRYWTNSFKWWSWKLYRWLTVMEYPFHIWQLISSYYCHYPVFSLSNVAYHTWIITKFVILWVTWRVNRMNQDLVTLLEYLNSPLFLVGFVLIVFDFECNDVYCCLSIRRFLVFFWYFLPWQSQFFFYLWIFFIPKMSFTFFLLNFVMYIYP